MVNSGFLSFSRTVQLFLVHFVNFCLGTILNLDCTKIVKNKIRPGFLDGRKMSQHRITLKKDEVVYRVLIGWDRPLKKFFLTIWENADEDATPIYCELDDNEAQDVDLDYFIRILLRFGLVLPARMIFEVKRDQALNAENKRVNWDEILIM